jgi:16S rRNA (guanine527-N7)-methyltransferase
VAPDLDRETQHWAGETLPNLLDIWQATLGWQPDAVQQSQFQQLYQLILAGNRQLNLTRITEPQEFWEKHLWDSLRGVFHNQGAGVNLPLSPFTLASLSPSHSLKAIDIGTGAGFPGIPVALLYPNWHITLLDSTHKKMAFLATLLTDLGLPNGSVLCDRAEQVGQSHQHREHYDLALLRAVAPASVCAEYALPLLRVGGTAILYRGKWTVAETEALQPALAKLGGTISHIEAFTTPLSQSVRHCLHVQKVAPTAPEFPRLVGVPAQSPL